MLVENGIATLKLKLKPRQIEISLIDREVMRTTNSGEITKLMLDKNQKAIELQGVSMAIDRRHTPN